MGWGRLNAWSRARAERAWNMKLMSVTPEVFQLEMSALKSYKPKKSPLMSETAETSQSVMGPYVAMAEVAFALYAWTAVFRKPRGAFGQSGIWLQDCHSTEADIV